MHEKIMVAELKGEKKRPGDSFTGPHVMTGPRKMREHLLKKKYDETRTSRDYRTTMYNGKQKSTSASARSTNLALRWRNEE